MILSAYVIDFSELYAVQKYKKRAFTIYIVSSHPDCAQGSKN